MSYNFKEIEKKWQKYWDENKTFYTDVWDFSKPKYYALDMFPYPSGQGLHVGHPEGYTATDIMSRMRRMQGYNVLHPMGWDAFGLPAEQYAIKTGNHPATFTKQNIETFKRQLKMLGFSFDWDKEISTCDPDYYKWTQWIFKQLYKDGLAKLIEMPVNWCEGLGCVLSNDEVIDGKSERGGFPVVRKNMKQWVLDIPKYADVLLDGLDEIDWPESTKEIQKNWIGKSVGAEVNFKVANTDLSFTVFTTRIDTLFGATYCVLAPEHELVKAITTDNQKSQVEEYVELAASKSDLERTELSKEKTGVFTGAYAINPANGKEIPIWISDYVLSTYGTGAIMAVPAHDERDYEFAKKFNIPICQVVAPITVATGDSTPKENLENEYRHNVLAIVKHWDSDKYLCLSWKTADWNSFVCGGFEPNESPEQAAIREVQEETGYTNIKLAKDLKMKSFNKAFAPHKNINRFAEFDVVYIELADGTQVETKYEDTKNHVCQWIAEKDIPQFINLKNNLDAFEFFKNDGFAFTSIDDGIIVNSDFIDGLSVLEAKTKMIEWLEENKIGNKKVNYKLREWIFARQRYWGEPIPIVYLDDEMKALADSDLPLNLPELEDYSPSKEGSSPLDKATDWVNTTFEGKKAKRETSTMPGSAGSSWYFLRYIDPKNNDEFANKKLLEHWLPVDLYLGGPEHAVGHLLYSRFWNNYLYNKGLVPVKEPFAKLRHQGMILGPNGEKMSKSKGNVINPDDMVKDYGADSLRVYEMFMGPLDAAKPWDPNGISGSKNFLDRVWRLFAESDKVKDIENKNLEKVYHYTVKKVSNDYESMSFNTAIAQMMIFINTAYKESVIPLQYAEGFLQLLNPIAPHITEELWNILGHNESIAYSTWPTYDEEKTKNDTMNLPIQINGKLRATIDIAVDEDEEVIKNAVHEAVKDKLDGKTIVKEIYVKNKIYNVVVK